MLNTPVGTVIPITPETAAKFLTSCSVERIKNIDATTLKKLHLSSYIPGTEASNSTPHSVNYKKGATLIINNMSYQVTDAGIIPIVFIPDASPIQAEDPITGIQGTMEVVEDKLNTIPGLEELPIDPSKLEPAHKIADLGEDAGHVLDIERAV